MVNGNSEVYCCYCRKHLMSSIGQILNSFNNNNNDNNINRVSITDLTHLQKRVDRFL